MKIYQAVPNNNKNKWISEIAIPLDYSKLPPGIEYDLFKHVFGNLLVDDECWGVVSWKFNIKSPVNLDTFHKFAMTEFKAGADCVLLNPMIANEAIYANPWEQGILCGHKGMEEVFKDLIDKKFLTQIGVIEKSRYSFCNYFVANNLFWNRYFNFVDPILQYLEKEASENTPVGLVYRGSAGYRKNIDMTMRPFIIERLLTSFLCQNMDLKVSKYQFTTEDYIHKLGSVPGVYCKNLADLKNLAITNQDQAQLESWHNQRLKLLTDKDHMNLTVLFHMDDPSIKLVEI